MSDESSHKDQRVPIYVILYLVVFGAGTAILYQSVSGTTGTIVLFGWAGVALLAGVAAALIVKSNTGRD